MKATTWTLGILAGVVLLAFVVAIAPKCRRPDPEYVSLYAGTATSGITALVVEGWKVDEVRVDSCGNMTLVFRKEN